MLGYTVLHRLWGNELISAPLGRYIPLCHFSALHSQNWSHTSVLDRQLGQCESTLNEPKGSKRIILSLPSELWTLFLLPFFLCSFLTCRNEQKVMNFLLGVDFEQPLEQEVPTSCLTDCMTACLQFGPEYIGEFQLLTCLRDPYF